MKEEGGEKTSGEIVGKNKRGEKEGDREAGWGERGVEDRREE